MQSKPRPGGPGREVGEGYKYVSYGLTFAGGVILFMLVGLWLDRRLGVTPLFTVAGTLVGAVLSFLSVYYRLEDERKKGGKGGGPR